jgi:hypothetical protein
VDEQHLTLSAAQRGERRRHPVRGHDPAARDSTFFKLVNR